MKPLVKEQPFTCYLPSTRDIRAKVKGCYYIITFPELLTVTPFQITRVVTQNHAAPYF